MYILIFAAQYNNKNMYCPLCLLAVMLPPVNSFFSLSLWPWQKSKMSSFQFKKKKSSCKQTLTLKTFSGSISAT